MIPETQSRAWNAIRASGALGRVQMDVYTLICERPGITRNKIDATLAPGKANPPHSRRLAELEAMGLIFRRGELHGQAMCWPTQATEIVKPLPKLSPKKGVEKIAEILARIGAGQTVFADPRVDEIRKIVRQVEGRAA